MSSFDFNYSSLGVGAEAFFTLDENLTDGPIDEETVAQATIKSGADSASDNIDADNAADAAETTMKVADAGAELFKDLQSLSSMKDTLIQHPLHPSLYAYLNANGQLDSLLQTTLPSVESLSSTGENSDLKDRLIRRLDELFVSGFAGQKSLKNRIHVFFDLFCNKLQKMQAAIDTTVINRRVRVGDLMFRMEDDDTPESADVKTDAGAEAPASAESDESSTEGDDPIEVPDTEKAEVDSANTAEECNRLMSVINVEGLVKGSALFKDIEASASGDHSGFKTLTDFTRKAARELAQFRFNGKHSRRIRFSKYEIKESLEKYYNMLDNWQNVNMLHYAIGQLAKQAKATPIVGAESLNAIMPLFHTAMMMHNYLQTSKKAMDAVYYNLQYAATKIAKKRYR